MKTLIRLLALSTITILVLYWIEVSAQQKEFEDKTLAPYFFVKSDDPDIDQLPLKSTSAVVNISGVIADVKVTQIYKNEGKRPLEAIYVFPASTRAAVYGMKMTIGERIITAKIKKREEARKDYEKAKQQGKSASLLEQQRPNVFQMNVANIMPGDIIKVELSYTELLIPTDKIYEFTYPAVVGPRYSNQLAETAPPSDRWVQNPYLHQGEAPNYTFDIKVNIAAGLPIHKIYCSSHKVNIKYDGTSTASIHLDKSEEYGGNRDYILKYQLAGEQIQSGLLLYQGEKENFFLLMLQPPKRVIPEQIPGREYIFIVDVSGSMYGFPLEISKKLLKDLISNLRPTDRFNVLLFSGGSSVMSEQSLPATPENIGKAISLIEMQRGGGGTELLPALKRALALPKAEGFSRTVVIATDGYVTVEEQTFELIHSNLGNANMFAFGIGTSVNRHIIEGMAHVGMGEPFVITKPEEAPAKAEAFRRLIQSPVLTQIKVDFDIFDAYDIEPLSIPDVLADRPVIVFGKWRGKPQGKITLSGISGKQVYTDTIDVSTVKPLKTNYALQYLWARHRIMLLSDFNRLRSDDSRIKEVTDLGLAYNLLTAYTSFVAIDTEIRNKDGQQTTVTQPLPLPEGVSDYAVGGKSGIVALKAMTSNPIPIIQEDAAKKIEAQQAYEKVISENEEKSYVKIDEIIVSGRLSKGIVQKIVQQHKEEFKKCYQRSNLHGKLVVQLIINADGRVKNVIVVKSGLKDKKVEQCMIQQIKTWHFPSIKQGPEVEATISLIF